MFSDYYCYSFDMFYEWSTPGSLFDICTIQFQHLLPYCKNRDESVSVNLSYCVNVCVCSMNCVILFKADYCAGTCFFSHTLLFSLCCRSRLCWRLRGQFLRVPAEGLAHVRQNWWGGKEALLRCPAGKVHCYREKKPREMLLYWPFDQMTRQLLTRQASLTSLFLEETCKLKLLVSAK